MATLSHPLSEYIGSEGFEVQSVNQYAGEEPIGLGVNNWKSLTFNLTEIKLK